MMRFDWTLKARITACAVLGAIVLIGLGASALWREQQMSQALRDIYEREVQPMQELQRIDATMKDVRFRLAGALPESGQHLTRIMAGAATLHGDPPIADDNLHFIPSPTIAPGSFCFRSRRAPSTCAQEIPP